MRNEDLSIAGQVDATDQMPWDAHIAFMVEKYGRRDPACAHCHRRVVMGCQGFYGGGFWTTNHGDEGPASPIRDQDALRCTASPTGEHEVTL